MGYTNETTHYGIPLPLGSDLTTPMDYNTAAEAVDTAVFEAVSNSSGAVDTAAEAVQTANAASTTAAAAVTEAQTAHAVADAATTAAGTAQASANTANNAIAAALTIATGDTATYTEDGFTFEFALTGLGLKRVKVSGRSEATHSGDVTFTIPEKYRPNTDVPVEMTGTATGQHSISVKTDGHVALYIGEANAFSACCALYL